MREVLSNLVTVSNLGADKTVAVGNSGGFWSGSCVEDMKVVYSGFNPGTETWKNEFSFTAFVQANSELQQAYDNELFGEDSGC